MLGFGDSIGPHLERDGGSIRVTSYKSGEFKRSMQHPGQMGMVKRKPKKAKGKR
jgi:hypothetical protein